MGRPPYEQWRREGLIPDLYQARQPPAVLQADRAAAAEFGVDQPLADAAVIVRHFLADRLALTLGDKAALDLFDETARTLVLARGPEGAADVITTLVSQVVALGVHRVAPLPGRPRAPPAAGGTAHARRAVIGNR